MNLNKLIKREIIITAVSVIAIATIFFGLTYALYMRVEETNIGKLEFSNLSFSLCADEECKETNNQIGSVLSGELYPMNKQEGLSTPKYLFELKNTGPVSVSVEIVGTIAMPALTLDYNGVTFAGKEKTAESYTITTMSSDIVTILKNIDLDPGETKVIELLMWGNENLSNEMINQTIIACINAVGYYYPEGSDEEGPYTVVARSAECSPNAVTLAELTYTGGAQEFEAPYNGYYEIELWGADGGVVDPPNDLLGQGAYTKGKIALNKGEKLYIYIGEAGSVRTSSTYNGGGKGGNGSTNSNGASGGGATDVRLVKGSDDTVWNETEPLNSRIMVASGGGGTSTISYSTAGEQSHGGRLIGCAGAYYSGHGDRSQYGRGGTQTSGGAAGFNIYSASGTNNAGQFGIGGDSNSKSSGIGSGGGGSGYYGGGAGGGTGSNGSGNGGGGGSSFISGYAGVNAITSQTDRTAANSTLHYSGKYFIDTDMEAAVNNGNGKAKISFVSVTKPQRRNTKLDNVRYIKDCTSENTVNTGNYWIELQAIKDGVNIAKGLTVTGLTNNETYPLTRITDGIVCTASTCYSIGIGTNSGTQCITIDLGSLQSIDEVAVWHYWADGRRFYNNITSVSSDNEKWIEIIRKDEVATSNGKRFSAWD